MAKAFKHPLFWLALLLAGGIAAYANAFSVPFLFDDLHSIRENQSIRHLWPLWGPLSPPHGGLTFSGRPLANLTLAVNYALGGWNVRGYHAFNLAVHLLAGLALYGIARRTLLRTPFGEEAALLAGVIALLWTLHPLQTESVTYLSQRVESMAGLCAFWTLYGFIRGVEAPGWRVFSVLACACGMACKETMAALPLLVLFYDRAFVLGSVQKAIELRLGYYVALVLTWVILGKEVAWEQMRSGTAGEGTITAGNYLVTQGYAIAHYVRLAFWPFPQIFDYGTAAVPWGRAWPGFLFVAAGVAATGWAFFRHPRAGFLGLWFFAILAPSSSVVPVATQVMAEHRLYLSLAALVAGAVLLLRRGTGFRTILFVGLAAAVGLGGATWRRNADYRSGEAIWRDTARKLPANGRAWSNWGCLVYEDGRLEEALPLWRKALEVNPRDGDAWLNIGLYYYLKGNFPESVVAYRRALALLPYSAAAHSNLGKALFDMGNREGAWAEYFTALRFRPEFVPAWNNLGFYYEAAGKKPEARHAYEKALQLDPGNAYARDGMKRLDTAR
ncbi:MAG: tetratricopeptide repeat protein [Verrucomicrobium sp.]|nr:tetratricopeptide repeat protein [Verrucomicrobium sp.]